MDQETFVSIESFDSFVELSENLDKLFEFIGEEIVEKMPSNAYVSAIATILSFYILSFLRENNLNGHVTGELGGYRIAGERYAPHVAYLSYEKQPELAKSGYNPIPPDLAIEVVSSDRSDEAHQLRIKVGNYLSEGTVVWIVQPDSKQVEVHILGEPVKIYREADTLTGGDVLPGFELNVNKVFDV